MLPGNREAWWLFKKSRTQWRIGIGGLFGLDYGPIIEMAKSRNIPLNPLFYEKLEIYEQEALSIIGGKEGKSCTEKDRRRCEFEYGEFFEWACKECDKNKR